MKIWHEFDWDEEFLADFLLNETILIHICIDLEEDKSYIKLGVFIKTVYPFDPDADAEFDHWCEKIYTGCGNIDIPDKYIDELLLHQIWAEKPELIDNYDIKEAWVQNTKKTEFCMIAEPGECSECDYGNCPRREE